jgi:hypothetical protein
MPKRKDHDIGIDGPKCVSGRDLAGQQDSHGSPEHDLPDPETEPAHLTDCNEQEDEGKYDDSDKRTALFSFVRDECWGYSR